MKLILVRSLVGRFEMVYVNAADDPSRRRH
jgi:hypothetical protein